MTALSANPVVGRFAPVSARWRTALFWAGLLVLAVPTLIENARQSWSTEQGEQGPIVLAIGLWLLARQWPRMRKVGRPGSAVVTLALGSAAALTYGLGRVSDQFLVESYALYGLVLTGVYGLVGIRGMAKGWFALAYLIFALPAPYTLTWMLTNHLRLGITQAAVAFYRALGFSIVRDGLDILVDQYVLAVREACSGMNSLVSLSAIGLVYIYIRRAPPAWYFLIMAVPLVCFAILGNFVRVLVLIALTHYFGDAIAQSYLHETAGLVTFLVALFGVIALDAAVAPLALSRRQAAA